MSNKDKYQALLGDDFWDGVTFQFSAFSEPHGPFYRAGIIGEHKGLTTPKNNSAFTDTRYWCKGCDKATDFVSINANFCATCGTAFERKEPILKVSINTSHAFYPRVYGRSHWNSKTQEFEENRKLKDAIEILFFAFGKEEVEMEYLKLVGKDEGITFEDARIRWSEQLAISLETLAHFHNKEGIKGEAT